MLEINDKITSDKSVVRMKRTPSLSNFEPQFFATTTGGSTHKARSWRLQLPAQHQGFPRYLREFHHCMPGAFEGS